MSISVENILAQANNLSGEERSALIAALTRQENEPPSPRISAFGKYPNLTPVEEFLREKHEEIDRENNRPG